MAWSALTIALASPPPPLPSSFWGTVKVNGANVPMDTLVTAWIGGAVYATTTVSVIGADTSYGLDVPGDIPDTPAKEGGQAGETVSFRIGNRIASQSAPWSSGANQHVDLISPGQSHMVTLATSPATQIVGGASRIVVTVTDNVGEFVRDGTQVTVVSNLGQTVSPILTIRGVATSTITSTLAGTARITATSGLASGFSSVVFVSKLPHTVTVTVNPTMQTVGHASRITVRVVGDSGQPVDNGTPVHIASDMGQWVSPLTTLNGVVTSSITSTLAGTAHITATSGPASGVASAVFVPGAPAAIRVQIQPATLVADSGSTAQVTATVNDAYANRVPGVALAGRLSPSTLGAVLGLGVTNSAGQAFGAWRAGAAGGYGVLSVGNGSITASAPITLNNPLPAVTGLFPASIAQGSSGFSLAITGTGFVSGSVVYWGGAVRPTTFITRTRLAASISASDVALAGDVAVTVGNPTPGGGISNPAAFSVRQRRPAYLPNVMKGTAR